MPALFFPVAVATPLLALLVLRSPGRRPAPGWAVGALAAGCALALGLAVTLPAIGAASYLSFQATVELAVITLALTGGAFVFVQNTLRFAKRKLTEREEQVWLMSGASLAIAYMLALSWAVYSAMAVPGLALVAGLALDRLESTDWRAFCGLAAAAIALVCGSTENKLARPFGWMYWIEPSISEAQRSSKLAKLSGLKISEPTLGLTEKVTRLIQDHTKPGDTLLVYPYFPLFYSLTELNPPTYGFNYYLDVCPDAVCREDAARVREHPPDAIVYMKDDEEALRKDEEVFRAGARSGSRDVAQAIEQAARRYQKLGPFAVPGSSRTIEVYVKPEGGVPHAE
jgi:hypothetical protein